MKMYIFLGVSIGVLATLSFENSSSTSHMINRTAEHTSQASASIFHCGTGMSQIPIETLVEYRDPVSGFSFLYSPDY